MTMTSSKPLDGARRSPPAVARAVRAEEAPDHLARRGVEPDRHALEVAVVRAEPGAQKLREREVGPVVGVEGEVGDLLLFFLLSSFEYAETRRE